MLGQKLFVMPLKSMKLANKPPTVIPLCDVMYFSVLSSYFLKFLHSVHRFLVTPTFDHSTRLGFWLLLSFLHKLQASNHQIPSTQLCGSN